MSDLERLAGTLVEVLGDHPVRDRGLRLVLGVHRIVHGADPAQTARQLKLQQRGLEVAVDAGQRKGLSAFRDFEAKPATADLLKRRTGIAQMLLGALAERRFEEIMEEIAGAGVLSIEDHRPSRSDTDYRLLNGGRNPICRLNIKCHGTLFRDAPRYVGLQPEDCFALATYKINNALKRQRVDQLPYVFVVLSVPDLRIDEVGALVPDEYVWALAVLRGKRVVEEGMVEQLRSERYREGFERVFERMPEGQFRVISAAKAYQLLKDKLFERVHALTLKGFTQRFRKAEVDMHFSLSQDLTPVRTFLELLKRHSPQRFAVTLYSGEEY